MKNVTTYVNTYESNKSARFKHGKFMFNVLRDWFPVMAEDATYYLSLDVLVFTQRMSSTILNGMLNDEIYK